MTTGTEARDRLLELDGSRSSGWWGALFGALTVGTVLAYLLYAYFYLFVSTAEWPPAGIPEPALLRPAGIALLLVASLTPLRSVHLATRHHDRTRLARGLGGVLVLGGVALAAGSTELITAGLQVDRSAYEAIVLTVHAVHGLVTVAGLIMVLTTLRQAKRLEHDAWVRSAGAVVVVWWSYVVVGWLAVGAVLYLWPQVS